MTSEPAEKAIHSAKTAWDTKLYDGKHSFVWKYGEEVVELLAPQQGERILDLGCGTGHLTHRISLSGATVVGLDRSPDMIEKARNTYPDIEFVQGNGADFSFAEPFDAVFSNAAIHWMKQQPEVVTRIAAALKPGGRFVAEFGGKGNLDAVRGTMRRVMAEMGYPSAGEMDQFYPSIGEYAPLLEEHGLEVRSAQLFDRPTLLEDGENGLRQWISLFGSESVALVPIARREEFLKKVEDLTRSKLFRDGSWIADYRRIRVVAVRR